MMIRMTTSDSDRRQVQELDRRCAEFAIQGDAAALSSILADDLRYVHATGTVDTKQSLVASIASGAVEYVSIESEDVEVRVIGDAAILTSSGRLHVRARGNEIKLRGLFLRVYVKGAEGWKLTFHQGTRLP